MTAGDRKHLVRPCPLCGSRQGARLAPLAFRVFDDSPICGSVSLAVCGSCGFAFNDTPDTQARYDAYYRQNAYYCSAATTGSGGASPQDAERFQALYRRVAPHLRCPGAAIVDVGCARGGLLSVLAQNGCEDLYGVDPLPECVGYVREGLGLRAETGSALELPFPGLRADLLVYSHVVEHVVDLPALLQSARERLAPEGVLYVEVPDASRYGEHTGNPYQDLYLEHVNHLDSSSLAALFGAGGFRVLESGRCEIAAPPAGKVSCAWAIFGKGSGASLRVDRALEQHLRQYLSLSARHPAHENFARLAESGTPLYLWGISQYAMLMLGQTPLSRANIRGFVDKDPSKRRHTLMGCPVHPPEVMADADPGCTVIATAPGYEQAIAAALDGMGFGGTVLTAAGFPVR